MRNGSWVGPPQGEKSSKGGPPQGKRGSKGLALCATASLCPPCKMLMLRQVITHARAGLNLTLDTHPGPGPGWAQDPDVWGSYPIYRKRKHLNTYISLRQEDDSTRGGGVGGDDAGGNAHKGTSTMLICTNLNELDFSVEVVEGGGECASCASRSSCPG